VHWSVGVTTPTVVVADEHAMTRLGVRGVLEDAGFVVAAEADHADPAVEACRRLTPSLCLLDVRLPGDGISAARRIAVEAPEVKVVMLTLSREDDDLFAALHAGAVGYLLKDSGPERLPHALHGALRGEAAIPRMLVGRVLGRFLESGGRRVTLADGVEASLTPREWDVLERLRRGDTTRAIAEDMEISEVTVRRHVSSVLVKLRVPDRASALEVVRQQSAR
jgi:two-component system, NarL family, nitrate/nitrite response regulator NarL